MSSLPVSSKNTSRRDFLQKTTLASLGIFIASKSTMGMNAFLLNPDSKIQGVQIGAITYSFRSMPGSAEQILQYCVDAGISAIEIMGEAAEAFAGIPVNPVKGNPSKPPILNGPKNSWVRAGY